MQLELIQPFVNGAHSVLGMVLGKSPTKGELGLLKTSATSKQLNILCGVTGPVAGHLMYGMTLQTADRIASRMVGQTIMTFDKLAASAIAELANMISGTGLSHLYDAGLACDISPPILVRGTQVAVNYLDIPAIVVPLLTDCGEFFVTVGLSTQQHKERAL